MNKASGEALDMAQKLLDELGSQSDVNIVLCAPYTALSALGGMLEGKNIALGAQNMHPEASGAFTGEISASMLRDLFVGYVILGHSERRHLLGEDDVFINKKVQSALNSSLRPILCVGETLEEREKGETKTVVRRQILEGLKEISAEQADRILIAYEPVWAIGTGKTATPEMAQEVHAVIRSMLIELWGATVAKKIPLLYGGSMKPDNAAQLLEQKDIDGGLIGGASLEVKPFLAIIQEAAKQVGVPG